MQIYGFLHVGDFNPFGLGQVGYGAGGFQTAGNGAGREAVTFNGSFQGCFAFFCLNAEITYFFGKKFRVLFAALAFALAAFLLLFL